MTTNAVPKKTKSGTLMAALVVNGLLFTMLDVFTVWSKFHRVTLLFCILASLAAFWGWQTFRRLGRNRSATPWWQLAVTLVLVGATPVIWWIVWKHTAWLPF